MLQPSMQCIGYVVRLSYKDGTFTKVVFYLRKLIPDPTTIYSESQVLHV